MFFLRLGLVNAWRNLTRSLLAILSMAFACAFLTYSFSLSRGYADETAFAYRAVLGGDVLVYEKPFRGDSLHTDDYWSFQVLRYSPLTDLADFHPELFSNGYLSAYTYSDPLDSQRMEELESAAHVRTVYPRYQIPAYTTQVIGSNAYFRPTPLRGRDATKDAMLVRSPADFIVEGRWFTEADDGKPVAVVSNYQHYFEDISVELPRIGDTLRMNIPHLLLNDSGFHVDVENQTWIELEIIGIINVETRSLTWNSNSSFLSEQLYWLLDEVQVPLATWQSVWSTIADTQYIPEQASLIMDDVLYLEDYLIDLRTTFPQHSFLSAMERSNRAQLNRYNETHAVAAPEEVYFHVERSEGLTFSEDLRLPISVALLLNAALVISANLLIMVGERKREVGILKAVGATGYEVIGMVLIEAVVIASIGGSAGFAVIRIQSALNQLTNAASIGLLLKNITTDALMAIGVSMLVSLLFGLVPALKMARLSVMEVLRNE